MIHYSLRCAEGHEFEGWFPSGEAFERQVKRKQIACAACGSTKVEKAPMAPACLRRSEAAPASRRQAISGCGIEDAQAREVRRVLDGMRQQVEKTCDYVGPAFAEEARRMHYGESDKRGIYGETSDEEARALADEGIGFARIPWPKRADS